MSVKSMDGKSVIKKTLPLIISLILIILIAVLATVLSKDKPDPNITNPEESFVTIGDYSVTNGTVYRNLKVNYGLFELQSIVDRDLLSDYLAKVTDDALEKRLKKAIYDNSSDKKMTDLQVEERIKSLSEDEVKLVEKAFYDSQYLIGRRTKDEVKDYYKLEEAKKIFAMEQFVKHIEDYEKEATENEEKETHYFTDSQVEAYFKAHYEPDVKALVVTFNSEYEALQAMKAAGVQKNRLNNKWIKYDPEQPDVDTGPELEFESLSDIIKAFAHMYNYANGYYDDSATLITDEDIEGLTINDRVEENPYVQINYNYELLNSKNAALASQLFKTLMVYEDVPEDQALTNNKYYTDDFHKAYTKNPTTDTNGRYYLAIKLGLNDEIPVIENVREEIKDLLTKESLTDTKISAEILQLRRDHGLIIYDKFFEKTYAGGDSDFKTTKKTHETIVASYKKGDQTVEVSADDLFERLALLYAPKDIANIINQEILVRDMTYNKAYDVINDKVLDEDEYEEFKQIVLYYRNLFSQGYFGQMGFPAEYGWKNFMRDNFGVETQKDLIVPLALYNYVIKNYREATYTVDDVIQQMKKEVNAFFEANIMNLIISVDYDNDNQPDKNIIGKIDPHSNWTDKQKNLVPTLVDAVLLEKSRVIKANDHAGAFKTVIERYNNASPGDYDYDNWKQFKEAGLRIEYQEYDEPTNNKTDFVEEFLTETEKLWEIAKEENLLGNLTAPLWSEAAFESSYGYHYIGITNPSDYVYADPDSKLLLTDMETDELKALIALYERELESNEDPDKPLTDAEEEEIEEKLTTSVRAAFTAYYTPAIQYLEESNSGNTGRIDLLLADYRAEKGLTFTNEALAPFYQEILAINKLTHDKTYDLEEK